MDKLSIALLEKRDRRVERIVDLIVKTLEEEMHPKVSVLLSAQILIRVGSEILAVMDDKSEEDLLDTMKRFTELVRDRLYRQDPSFEQMRITLVKSEVESDEQ